MMEIRDALAKKPALTAGAVVGVVILSIAFSIYSILPDRTSSIDKAFYSDDDGKTWFVGSKELVPPFDHGGKVAVRAQVFSCGSRKGPFVGYLERYIPDVKRKLDESVSSVASGKRGTLNTSSPDISLKGMEFKKPGDAIWTPATDLKAKQKLFRELCPSNDIDTVLP